ncbi:ROK family protein [Acerihabitans arboris]|uniref:ROK family protein n=1 Tax=Acerihabitans arboris TaxID=2691583 RepID=A0A845SFV2_9GAMM|nr:ROK family protein [Acerihabitans arboris]NDL61824.1 ROK family protein [Acerihabitans arboris]
MDYPLTSNTQQLKLINVAHVIEALKALNGATKSAVAQATGLSVATCGTILNGLCATGEVLQQALEESSGGRPAQRFVYNEHFFYVLSLFVADVYSDHVISYRVTSAGGNIVCAGKEPGAVADTGGIIACIAEHAGRYNIQAVGIGLPGVIVGGKVLTCDIPAFEGVALQRILTDRFGLFTKVGNDMNYTAYGFYKNRGLGKDQPLAYLMFPEKHCPGCGIIVGGKALEGATQFAGEVAHLPWHVGVGEVAADGARYGGPADGLARTVADIAISLISIINPGIIAITGARIGPETMATAARLCQAAIPREHLPEIIYREGMEDDYLKGIAEMTLESANYQRLFGAAVSR